MAGTDDLALALALALAPALTLTLVLTPYKGISRRVASALGAERSKIP